MKQFLGIDIGTQGVRVVVLDQEGNTLAAGDQAFQFSGDLRIEQDPLHWWEILDQLLIQVLNALGDKSKIHAIGVTSTSGTIIPIDWKGNPLHSAIMYSDQRSAEQGYRCQALAKERETVGYTAFNSSSGLPKMIWFLENFPEKRHDLYKFIHASDFITGTLSGNFGVTDYTNGLKSGYNLHEEVWPSYIMDLGVHLAWLQDVVPSGYPIGKILPTWAERYGLSPESLVTAGMTDGCVSQVASGAVAPGEWNTTIGTTLVIKGVSTQEIRDPSGAIYNHRHPQGYWMPGGASNTGADWVSHYFGGQNLKELGEKAEALVPTGDVAWPLLQHGERFPFFSPQARGFMPEGKEDAYVFACGMEGVAYIEKMAYDRIEELSGQKVNKVFSAGGGSNSDLWMKIRSTVLQVPIQKMANTTGAAGAAILAASGTFYEDLPTAARKMIKVEKVIEPETRWIEKYQEGYKRFLGELKSRNIC